MQEDNLLFRLPNTLFIELLSEWLDIYDMGMLDTAMTNRGKRLDFLRCLSQMRNPTVPYAFDGSVEHDIHMLQWISCREIHVEELSLARFENNDSIKRLRLPSLRKFEVGSSMSESPPWLPHISQLSPSLEELTIGRFTDGATVDDLIFVLRNCLHLKNFFIDMLDVRGCLIEVLEGLQEVGHLLVDIRIVNGNLSEDFQNFIRHCSRLRKLDFSYFEDNGALMKCVAQSCPLLEEIEFDACSTPALLELCQNCKLLRNITVRRLNDEFAGISAAQISVLKQIDTLEELTLICCGLTDEKLAVISEFRHVKRLNLLECDGIAGLTGA